MDIEQGEGELVANAVEGSHDPDLAVAQDRNTFGPAGAEVDHGEGVCEGAGGELAAVGDEVDLQVAGNVAVGPAPDDCGDLLAEQGCRAWSATSCG